MLRILFLLAIAAFLAGCSYVPSFDKVIPDKRTDYKKSQSLPDLEIPPDLTSDAISDSMNIPNEGGATLSQYQRQRNAPAQPAEPAVAAPAGAGEQWVSVRGSRYDIWPRLRTFFRERGFTLELDDAELGVLETGWSKPEAGGAFVYRHKFKVFSEPGADPAVTVLFVSSARQEQVQREDGTADWVDQDEDAGTEKQLAGELNVYLNASSVAGAAPAVVPADADALGSGAPATGARKGAELLSAGDGKMYLAIPEEFTHAWQQTETALQRGGFIVDGKDAENGVYHITYFDSPEGEEKKGWMSKLAFWKDEEPEGRAYRLSLTGVGDKTEVVVLNAEGEWETNEDAARILAVLQHQYNTR